MKNFSTSHPVHKIMFHCCLQYLMNCQWHSLSPDIYVSVNHVRLITCLSISLTFFSEKKFFPPFYFNNFRSCLCQGERLEQKVTALLSFISLKTKVHPGPRMKTFSQNCTFLSVVQGILQTQTKINTRHQRISAFFNLMIMAFISESPSSESSFELGS